MVFGENLNASTLECKYSLVHSELTDHFGNKFEVTLYLHLAQRESEGNREDGPSQFGYCPAEGKVTEVSQIHHQQANCWRTKGLATAALLQTSKGPAELTPLFGISNPLVFKAPPNGRQYMQWHANILMKAMQSTSRHQILGQTIDSIETHCLKQPNLQYLTNTHLSKVLLLSRKIPLTPTQTIKV